MSLQKPKSKAKAILKIYELLFMDTDVTLLILKKNVLKIKTLWPMLRNAIFINV